jgi:superfamily II DNA or RNA helicase
MTILIRQVVINNAIYSIVSSIAIKDANKSRLFLEFTKTYRVEFVRQIGRRTKTEEYQPFTFTKGGIIIPRFLHDATVELLGAEEDVISKYPTYHEYQFVTELWPEKQAIIASVMDKLATGGCTLQLDTGKGKTVIIANVIHQLGARTVVFAANKILQDQLYDDIRQHLASDEIGRIGGGHGTNIDADTPIYIALVNTAVKLPPSTWDVFDLTIFDECHRFCSPVNFELMKTCKSKWVFALSASVQKKWDWTKILHHCGEFVDGNKNDDTPKMPGIVRAIRYKGPPEYTQRLTSASGMMCMAYMSEQFAKDPERNALVERQLRSLLADGHGVMIISNTNGIITRLYESLKDSLVDSKPGLFNAMTKPVEKQRIKDESMAIFTNYACSSEGVNIPRITAMIFLTPFVNNGIQISGRAMRGKSTVIRIFVDIIDTPLKSQYKARLETWLARGFLIEYSNENH